MSGTESVTLHEPSCTLWMICWHDKRKCSTYCYVRRRVHGAVGCTVHTTGVQSVSSSGEVSQRRSVWMVTSWPESVWCILTLCNPSPLLIATHRAPLVLAWFSDSENVKMWFCFGSRSRTIFVKHISPAVMTTVMRYNKLSEVKRYVLNLLFMTL